MALFEGGTTVDADGYRYHVFTESGTLTLVEAGEVDVLIVAGGGGGGSRQGGGGGGAGGVVLQEGVEVTENVTVTVGAGGAGGGSDASSDGEDGEASSFGTIDAVGGGGGGRAFNASVDTAGRPGGSGGGSGRSGTSTLGGAGTVGQGNDGGNNAGANAGAAGGGGASAAGSSVSGSTPADGGDGITLASIGWSGATGAGAPAAVGGGGGGGDYGGAGGAGGGGAGSSTLVLNGESGGTNTGGGGGGGGRSSGAHGTFANGSGGAGGSGLVIVRYPFEAPGPDPSGYADRFTATVPSADGATYRVRILLDGAASSAELDTAPGGVVLRRGRPGDPLLYEPIPGGELSITFLDETGALAEMAAAPLGRYVALLEVYDAAEEAWSVLWMGFVAPDRYRDEPFSALRSVTVRAVEGWALLQAETLSGDREVTYLLQWAAAAMGYADGTRIYSAGLWRPWLPEPQLATRDPLRVVVPLAAFSDDRGDPLDGLQVVQEAFRTFGVRAVQGPDPNGQGDGVAWWLLLRDALRGGTADVWYRRVGGLDFGGPDATDFVFDEAAEMAAGRLRLERAPGREIVLPVRRLVSTFDPPPADNLVANGSFETAGDDTDEAAHWEHDPAEGGERIQLSTVTGPTYTAAFGNEWCFILWGRDEAGVVGLVQDGKALIPAGGTTAEAAHCLRLTAMLLPFASAGTTIDDPARLYLSVSRPSAEGTLTYYLTGEPVVVGVGLPRRGGILVEPLFSGVSGAVAGTLALPSGTRLLFRDPNVGTPGATFDPIAFTLDRPAYVGDTVLYGSADGDLDAGYEALGCYWSETRSPVPHYEWYTDKTEFQPEDFAAVLVAPDGAVVSGAPRIEVEHPWSSELSGEVYYDEIFALLDAVRLDTWQDANEESGETEFSYTSEAESEDETHGLDVELREFLVGDGPTVDSTSGLQAHDGNGDLQPTMQGANTGWKEGSYADEEPSTGEAFVELRGRVEREAQRLPLQRRIFTAHFRDGGSGGTRFEPHQVWRHTATGRLAAAADAGAEEVLVYEPLRTHQRLAIGGQSYRVTEVEGAGPYTVGITPALGASAEAGAAFTYLLDLVWDYLEWDVARGALRFEGTELLPASPPTVPVGVLSMLTRSADGAMFIAGAPLDLASWTPELFALEDVPGTPTGGFWYDDESALLYVASDDDKVYVRDTSDDEGAFAEFAAFPGAVTNLVGGGGRLYVPCNDGTVYYVPLSGGAAVAVGSTNASSSNKDLAYDEELDRLFFVDDDTIYYYDFGSSQVVEVYDPGTGMESGIALDTEEQRVFYTERQFGSGFEDFWSVGYDGGGAAEFDPRVGATAQRMVYDARTGIIYYHSAIGVSGISAFRKGEGDAWSGGLGSPIGYSHSTAYGLQLTSTDFGL